jgi:NodT family efflux transporter outer membrane factor (OMF) lipoprotein
LNPRRALIALASLALSGCLVGPDFEPPPSAAPDAWRAPLASGLSGDAPADDEIARWWDALGDPLLVELEQRAAAANRDIASAQARLREARARRSGARAGLFPNSRGSATASQSDGSGALSAGIDLGSRELYDVSFDASWEIDLFGGKRRALEAANASLEASESDLQDVLVSLIGEVALSYVDLRAFQARLTIAESNLEAQSEIYDIARWRYEAGLTTARDVEQARFNLEQTRSQIPSLRTGVEQSGHRVALLLGQGPGVLAPEWAQRQAIPRTPLEVAIGVPADALRRRPDIRRAERQLAAQTAQIGVATVALYPSFSLFGSIGLEALAPGRLVTAAARATSFGGNASWTLFDAGRIRQNIAAQAALQEQALGRYEATILAALREVEDALVAYANEQARGSALRDAAAAARNAFELARTQYESGLVDFQVVLDTQRSVLSLQDQVAVSDGQVASNLIRLYKALGGGWTPLEPSAGKPG